MVPVPHVRHVGQGRHAARAARWLGEGSRGGTGACLDGLLVAFLSDPGATGVWSVARTNHAVHPAVDELVNQNHDHQLAAADGQARASVNPT
jgi:hypothetical protein